MRRSDGGALAGCLDALNGDLRPVLEGLRVGGCQTAVIAKVAGTAL